MAFFQLFLFVVSFIATALLAPKPRREDMRPSTLDDLNTPQASEGAPIPIVYGKVRLRGPNTLWYGNFRAREIRQEIGTDEGAPQVFVGYRYRLMMHLGLCLGPGVKMHQIYIDKNLVFNDDVGLDGETNIAANINMPSLFGGTGRGGGFVGQFLFSSGAFTPLLVGNRYGTLESPDYIGMSHVILRGLGETADDVDTDTDPLLVGTAPEEGGGTLSVGTNEGAIIGEAAQLRPFSFTVSRYPNSLGLADPLIGEDLNPMCALYDLLTSDWGGSNVDTTEIDIPSFTAAAATLLAEGNGLSLTISRSQNASAIVEEILRQVDGLLYQNPETGLFTMRLIRSDYTVSTLDEFDESDIVSIKNFSRTTWDETFNQTRVTYTSRAQNYEQGSALAQDLANIQDQGRLRSTNISFPGVTTGQLATSIATRELAQLSVPLVKATLELNRVGADLRPGDPFILSWEDYGISRAIMRVTRFDLGELIQGRVVIDCVQDVLSIAQSLFAAPADSLFVEPERNAVAVTETSLQEAPSWIVRHTGQQKVRPSPLFGDSYLLAFARQPNKNQLGFSTSLTQDNFIRDVNIGIDREPYNNSAILAVAIEQYANYSTGIIPSMNIRQLVPSQFLVAYSAEERSRGAGLFVMNDEIFNYESFTDNMMGAYTLTNVRRALLDTTFEMHAANSVLHFMDVEHLVSGEYSSRINNGMVRARFNSYTGTRAFGFSNAANVDTVVTGRVNRPLPPKGMTIGGVRSAPPARTTIAAGGDIVLAWNPRSRDQANIISDQATAGLNEPGASYLAVFTNDAGTTELATVEIPLGNSATIQVPATVTGDVRLNLYSIRGTLRSSVAETALLTVGSSDVGGEGQGARYWRILIELNNGGTHSGSGDIELRSTVGGADLTSGLAVSAYSGSSQFSSGFAYHDAFDERADGTPNRSTYWATTTNQQNNAYITIDFGAGNTQTVRELAIQAYASSAFLQNSMRDFELLRSNDGITFTRVQRWIGITGWTSRTQVRIFNVSNGTETTT